MSYRELAAPDVDKTEVEKERIRQAEETKRERLKQAGETRRKLIDEVGIGRTLVGGALGIGVIITVGVLGSAYLSRSEHKSKTCSEQVFRRDTYHTVTCEHPLHVLTSDEKTWTCKCGVPRLP